MKRINIKTIIFILLILLGLFGLYSFAHFAYVASTTSYEKSETTLDYEELSNRTDDIDEETVKTEVDASDNTSPDVIMYASKTDCNGRSNKFVLQNQGDGRYTYGYEYSLERQIDGQWTEIVLNPPLTWNAQVLYLEPGSLTEFEVDLTIGFGELEEGIYRLRKDIKDEEGNHFVLYAEFAVSDNK